MNAHITTVLSSLPLTPGIYKFKDPQGRIIYVGKAKQLKRRVSQYFTRGNTLDTKTQQLVTHIHDIEFIKTDSEFDALLLESQLIRTYLPKYNIAARDDKSPLYICLTMGEELPQILFLRKSQLPAESVSAAIFGPFQSATVTRHLMRYIRTIVPYCTQKKRTGRSCFYTHLHLCSPCPSYISKLPHDDHRKQLVQHYRRHMFRIVGLLSGKGIHIRHQLEAEMRELAAKNQFEEAQIVKKHLNNLYQLTTRRFDPSVYLEQPFAIEDSRTHELDSLVTILKKYYPKLIQLSRIECIDISNTGGTYATGSLVVLTDGAPNSGQYRRFKIRLTEYPNDVAMIGEVVRRRMKHPEWHKPDLLVIDGGKPQVRVARIALAEFDAPPPIIGLAKRFEEIIVYYNGEFQTIRLPLTNVALHVLLRIRDEAHRFAKKYHIHLRSKALFSQALR